MPAITLPNGFIFSQTSLQDYSDCRLRFQLRYLEKMEWPAVEMEPALENERRQMEGQYFHRLVQQHTLGIPLKLEPACIHPICRGGGIISISPIPTEGLPISRVDADCTGWGQYRMFAKFDFSHSAWHQGIRL
jgi:hypothetical protein